MNSWRGRIFATNAAAGGDSPQLSIGGFAALDVHLRMLRDAYRVLAYGSRATVTSAARARRVNR